MKCPKCNSERTVQNGHRRVKQCYRCQDCERQFVESPIELGTCGSSLCPLEVKQLSYCS